MTLNLIHRKFKKKENNIYLNYFYLFFLFMKNFIFLLDKIFKIWLIILEIINI
jgi:hypothetical protein